MLERDEPQRFIRRGRTHVRQFLLANGVDVEVVVFGVLPDNHALVQLNSGTAEKFATFLQTPERISRGNSVAIRDERSGQPVRNIALPLDVPVEQGIHNDGPARIGEQLAAQANQAAARNSKLNAYPAVAVIVHIDDGALPCTELL